MDIGLKQDIVNKLIQIFQNEQGIDKAILFGSRANGNFRENSDIDIALFGDITFGQILKLRRLFDELNLPYKLDLLNFSTLTNEELKSEILNGVILFDSSLV